jgi:hypothetical protein
MPECVDLTLDSDEERHQAVGGLNTTKRRQSTDSSDCVIVDQDGTPQAPARPAQASQELLQDDLVVGTEVKGTVGGLVWAL